MRQKGRDEESGPVKEPAEQLVKKIGRATRRQFSAEEKIRIVLTGLRGEDSIAELCRREGIERASTTPIKGERAAVAGPMVRGLLRYDDVDLCRFELHL